MSLRLWLPLNGDLHNQGLDDVTVTTTGTITWNNSGKIGKGFDISGGYVRYTVPSIVGTNIFSVSFWYKPISNESLTANWNRILIFTTKTTDDTEGALFRFESSYNGGTSNTYAISVHNNVGEPIASVGHTLTGEWDKWHHIVAASDGTNMYTYCDNVLIRTSKCNGGTLAGGVYVGHSGARPNGIMNDVRVYDHCLSAKEVKELSKGLVLHYPLNRGGFGQDNLLKGSYDLIKGTGSYNTATYRDSGAGTTYNQTMPSGAPFNKGVYMTYTGSRVGFCQDSVPITAGTLTQTAWIKAPAGGTISLQPYWWSGASGYNVNFTTNGKWQKLVATVDTNTKTQSMSVGYVYYRGKTSGDICYVCGLKVEYGDEATPWLPNSADPLYSEMGLNDGIEYDVSGYQHNGEIIGALTYTSDTPRYNVSTHVGATNQKIHVSGLTTSGFGNSYSFAWWGKRSSNSPMFWGFSDGIRLNGMYIGNLWNTGDGSSNPLYNIGTTTQVTAPSTGIWHHYVMTGNGSKCYVYLDGELWAEAKTYKAISGTSIYINGWDSGTSYCSDNTSISDFRIYSTALDAEQVKALYNTPTSIASNGTLLTQGEISEV